MAFVDANKLETLKRRPSDLRRYIAWSQDTKAQYGSITNYLIEHRLPWGSPPFTSLSAVPFEEPADYKILLNDWPCIEPFSLCIPSFFSFTLYPFGQKSPAYILSRWHDFGCLPYRGLE
jgi:hypothetical protein